MKFGKRSRLSSLSVAPFVVVLLAMGSRPAPAGQIAAESVQLADLARTADAIVLTTCDAGISEWTGDPPIIVTRHQCRVERAFKGSPESTVTVQVLGGQVGDVGMVASAGASVTPGADTVLLLRRSQYGPYHVIAGGVSGALAVSGPREQRTVRGMSLDDFGRWVAR